MPSYNLNFNDILNNEIVLNEGLANVRKKYLDSGIMDKQIFDELIEADPTNQKKYSDWTFKQIYYDFKDQSGRISQEDTTIHDTISEIGNALKAFDYGLSKKLVTKRDIFQYKSLKDLFEVIAEIRGKQTKSELKKDAKYAETDKIFENDTYLIVVPRSWEASKLWGKGAQWCIGYTDSMSYWKTYVHERRLKFYFIINKTIDSLTDPNGKIAFGVDEMDDISEAYDARDRAIDHQPILNDLEDAGVPVQGMFVHEGWEEIAEEDTENIAEVITADMDELLEGESFEHTYVEYDYDDYSEGDPEWNFHISHGITIDIPKDTKLRKDFETISEETDKNIRSIIDEHSTYEIDYDYDINERSISYRLEVDNTGSATDTLDSAIINAHELDLHYDEILAVTLKALDKEGIIDDPIYTAYNEIYDGIENAIDNDKQFRSFENIEFELYSEGNIEVQLTNITLLTDEKFADDMKNLGYRAKELSSNKIERAVHNALSKSSGPKKEIYNPNQTLLKGILPKPIDKYKVDKNLHTKATDALGEAEFSLRGNFYKDSTDLRLTFEFEFKPGMDIESAIDYLEVIDANYAEFNSNLANELNKEFKIDTISYVPTEHNESFSNLVDKLLSRI